MHRQLQLTHSSPKARPGARIFGHWTMHQPAGELPALIDDVIKIHEYERQRIGQELHDSAGQLLVALKLSVARLRDIEGSGVQADLIREIEETVREMDREIRSLAFLHYPAELGTRSLCSSIESLAVGFGQRTGIRTSFACIGAPPHPDESTSTAVLRVAQEALVNVHRHSHAASAEVTLRNSRGRIELTICDDGIGMPSDAVDVSSRGIGISGMRHRVESLDGTLTVESAKRGTKVCATLPVAS